MVARLKRAAWLIQGNENPITFLREESFMKLYVGNLPKTATEDSVRQLFAAFGQVAEVTLIKDKFTNALRGFGFIEMPTQSEAEAAIAGVNGADLEGNKLVVNEARPRPPRPEGHRGGGPRGEGGHRGGFGGGRSRF